MPDEPKQEKNFGRYEVVAVALPGAALLLFLYYLHPELAGKTQFELKDVTLGSLGIFAIGAFVVGQVLQAVSNLVEDALNWVADRVGRTPAHSLPPHLDAPFVDAVRGLGVANPDRIDRVRYRRELNKSILGIARARGATRMLEVYNVSYGANRGFAVAAGIATVSASYARDWRSALVFALVCAAMGFRAYRFSRRFEGEVLRRFLDAPGTTQPAPPATP